MGEKYNYTLVSTARDATKYPEMHRTAPAPPVIKNYSIQNISCTEVEKPCICQCVN